MALPRVLTRRDNVVGIDFASFCFSRIALTHVFENFHHMAMKRIGVQMLAKITGRLACNIITIIGISKPRSGPHTKNNLA